MKRLKLSSMLLLIMMLVVENSFSQSTLPKVWLDTAGTFIGGVAAGPQWIKRATAANNVRGMAYNPVTKHILVATRDSAFNCIMILSAATGDTLGRMNMTGSPAEPERHSTRSASVVTAGSTLPICRPP